MVAPGQEPVPPPPPPPQPPPVSASAIEPNSADTASTSTEAASGIESLCADLAQISYSCASIALTPEECNRAYRGSQGGCAAPFQSMMECIGDAGFMCEGENYRSINKCDVEIQAMEKCATSTAAGVEIAEKSSGAENSSKAKRKFIKGNIVHLGTRELVSRFDHISLRAGPRIIGKDFYLTVAPSGALYTDSFAFAFNVPLNMLLYEGASIQTSFEDQKLDFGGFKIRAQDWDELSDFARVIRFITYGRKESPVYFTITNLRPTTLGHGQLVHNYQPNLDTFWQLHHHA